MHIKCKDKKNRNKGKPNESTHGVVHREIKSLKDLDMHGMYQKYTKEKLYTLNDS